MIRRRRTFPFLGFSVLLASVSPPQVSAQAENVPDRWQVTAEFSLTDQSGNKVLRLLTGGLKVSHLRRDDFQLDAAIQSRYGRSEDELVVLSHTASLAFDFRPEERWSPFLYVEAERDEFKRLDVRLSSGAGVKRTLYQSETAADEVSLSGAVLHSYERIAPQAGEADEETLPAEVVQLARLSWRGRATFELRDGVTLRHTTYYQPVWDKMADYLLRSDTGLKILLTERLALSVEYQLKRDARPPEGVERDDRLLTTGIIIDF